MDVLVGDDGRVWNPYGYDLLKHLGYFGGDADLVSYAVRNLGFAALRIRPRFTLVRVRPSLFPQACLHRVIELLIVNEAERVVIDRLGQGPAPLDVIHNCNDAIARLRLLQQATPDESGGVAPHIMGLSLDRLNHPKRAGMKAALAAWKAARGYVASGEAAVIAQGPVYGGGGMMWLPGGERCLVHAWPQTYSRYDDRLHERYLGWDVMALPDAAYMLPTVKGLFAASGNQTPRLELIEALISHPDGSRYWTRYERLVLPWRNRSSDCFVSSVPLPRVVRPY